MSVNFPQITKIVLSLFGIVLVMAILSFGVLFLQSYRELEQFQSRESALEERLSLIREQITQREKYLDLVLHEPNFLERVVRQKLGYARPDDTIYRFEDEEPEAIPE